MTTADAKNWFNIYYSQNKEDLIIKSFFPDLKDGFYVDIGAHDPEYFSVTKIFYDMGWTGVNIEPQKTYYQRLAKHRPKDVNLNIAVGKKNGMLKLREYPEASGLSTVSSEIKDSYVHDKTYAGVTNKFIEHEVVVKSLQSVLSEYVQGRTINFLKIDVEGFEHEVLEGNDWKRFRPELICIEANHVVNPWGDLLADVGYQRVFFDGLNEYYVSSEAFARLDFKRNYVQAVLSKIPLPHVPFKMFSKEVTVRDRELAKLNELILRQDQLIKRYRQDLENYNQIKGKLGYRLSRVNLRLKKYLRNAIR